VTRTASAVFPFKRLALNGGVGKFAVAAIPDWRVTVVSLAEMADARAP
jgi:hypothetical protein